MACIGFLPSAGVGFRRSSCIVASGGTGSSSSSTGGSSGSSSISETNACPKCWSKWMPPKQSKDMAVSGCVGVLKQGTQLETEESLASYKKYLNPKVIAIVIQDTRCVDAALFFFRWVAREAKGLHNNYTCGCMLKRLVRVGRIEEADRLFTEEMVATGLCKRDIVLYNTLIGPLCKAENLERANALLEEMKQNGIAPNVVTHAGFVKHLSETGSVGKAVEYVRKMECEPDFLMVNGLMKALCKDKNRLPQAQSFLDEMAGRGLADVVAYNTLINAFCESGAIENARGLLDTMVERGCKPNLFTFSTLIHSYCKIGSAGTAYRFMEQMQQLGIKPDVVTYNGLISGFCQNGRTDRAYEVLAVMKDKGCPPNSVTYGVLIKHLCKDENKIEEIEKLLTEIREKGVTIDRGTLNTLIVTYCKAYRIQDALKLRDEMAERCLILDGDTYGALVSVLAKEARTDEALDLLDEMLKMGFTPSNFVLETVLESFVASGKLDEAIQLLHLMSPVGVLEKLISGLCDERKPDDALKVLMGLKSQGTGKLPMSCYEAVIKSLVDNGEESEAISVFEDLSKEEIVDPDGTSYQNISELVTRLKEVKESTRVEEVQGSIRRKQTRQEQSSALVEAR